MTIRSSRRFRVRKKATAKSYTSTQYLTQSENSDDQRNARNEQPHEVLGTEGCHVAQDDHPHNAYGPENRFFQGFTGSGKRSMFTAETQRRCASAVIVFPVPAPG